MTHVSIGGVRLTGREILGAIAAAVLINLIGALGVPFTTPDSAWFQALEKPWFYPPGAAFGIVWTVLFTLMGLAAFLIYRRGFENRAVKLALGVFALQMVVNVAWSPAFFAAQELLLALGIIVALWVLIVATIVAFSRVDRRAAALLVPYLAWVSFAAVLNYSIWALN
ncbi:TspO/MBR family protein [Halalkalicoccus jeotgali]|uniref:TspO and MBR like protein n=1 Tax=Halalkalicoccus jeotgali (strain DSM 18796 / CECT 7217 / JCM 14584 / KCTC 4019 / B3) TaxID=795797 RepID=D8J707_HALJB|nr:TspO/MBR family protein [Halalkalicoccus jeotgali]ADJ15960.1 TspO and MBR like protein [Halalkalicoccus jeotgali B3]ELY38056.1 TspO and MBR like protein [Halalkalicoccus jeotgali B3]